MSKLKIALLERENEDLRKEVERLKKAIALPGEASISVDHYLGTKEMFIRWATTGRYYAEKA